MRGRRLANLGKPPESPDAQAGPRKPPTPPNPPAAPQALPPGQPPPRRDTVIRKCGHPETVESIRSRDCADCKAKNRAGRLPPDSGDRGRLPNGAQFHVVYDADKQQWSGTLEAGGVDAPVFEDIAGGIFHLLRKLDKQYRSWRKQQVSEEGPK